MISTRKRRLLRLVSHEVTFFQLRTKGLLKIMCEEEKARARENRRWWNRGRRIGFRNGESERGHAGETPTPMVVPRLVNRAGRDSGLHSTSTPPPSSEPAAAFLSPGKKGAPALASVLLFIEKEARLSVVFC
jgi:hypothetical protein